MHELAKFLGGEMKVTFSFTAGALVRKDAIFQLKKAAQLQGELTITRRLFVKNVEDGHVVTNAVCFNCGKRMKFRSARNGLYCSKCWRACAEKGIPMKHSFKCVIPGCSNRTDQGDFAGNLCVPCCRYVMGETLANTSQAYRNELVKSNLRLISTVEKRRRHVAALQSGAYACPVSESVHDNLENVRLLMTAVLNDNLDLLEKTNKDLFVARAHAIRESVHRQPFGGPLTTFK